MIRRDRGFTLLEVLLAMTVLGVVVAMLSLSLSGSMLVFEGTERDEELYSMAQAAMRRISEDLAAAFASKDGPFRGENEVEDGRRVDRLRFCSLAHLVFNPDKQQPGPALIGYRLEKEDGEDRKYRLLRSDQPLLPGQEAEDEEMNPPAFVLADNLRSFQCTYFDRQGQEFDSWQVEVEENNSEKKEKLPAAVHCILEFWVDADMETTQMFSTRIVVPVGAYGAN